MTIKDNTYKIPGGKVGVLLVHGLCGAPMEMRFVAQGLARAGYTVHCPQLAGHCSTVEEAAAATWQDWYASVDAALTELRRECDVVVVGGLSTGAILSLHLAANRPEDVAAVVQLAPTLWVNGWNVPWYARLFRIVSNKRLANLIRFPDLHPHGLKDDRVREMLINALKKGDTVGAGLVYTPGGLVLEHRWLVQAVKSRLGAIRQPTLIVHPREDDLADISNAHYLQRHLGGAVEMVVLEDSYHNVTIDRQRHVVVERTKAFIGRVVEAIEAKAGSRSTVATLPTSKAA